MDGWVVFSENKVPVPLVLEMKHIAHTYINILLKFYNLTEKFQHIQSYEKRQHMLSPAKGEGERKDCVVILHIDQSPSFEEEVAFRFFLEFPFLFILLPGIVWRNQGSGKT